MILIAGPPGVVSFTDETSLDQRRTAGRKVSIHCEVLRGRSLDWYYRLLQRTPNRPGELKSRDAIKSFLSLPNPERQKVFDTLKLVRVFITDPRPYIADCEAVLSRIIPGVNAKDLLVQLERIPKEVAERIHRESDRLVARRMLWDSPSARLKLEHRLWTSFLYSPPWMSKVKQRSIAPDVDLGPFEDGKSRIKVNSISVFVSKSGSVFFRALDELHAAAEKAAWPVTAWDFRRVYSALNQSHAFDDGNQKALDWIDSQRENVVAAIDPYFRFQTGREWKQSLSIDSERSYYIQAADIAAGIVRTIWDQQSLVHVVLAFEYVTYNGMRIGEDAAARITASLAARGASRPEMFDA